MFEMPDAVVEWLAHSALGGGLVLLLGAVLMGCVRQPAFRQRLGELALLSSLLVAGLCRFPSYVPWAIPLLPAEEEAPAAMPNEFPPSSESPPSNVLVGPPLAMAEKVGPLADFGDEAPPWFLVIVEANEPAAAGATPIALDYPEPKLTPPDAVLAAAAESASPWPKLLPWLGVVYLSVTAYFLVRCFIGHIGLYRLVKASVPPTEHVARLFSTLIAGLNSKPRLRVSSRVSLPVSFGLLRPTILVPPSVCRPGEEEALRLVLVHELTHLHRRDAWSCLLLTIGQAVYFYLPWLWWLRRQVRLCQEYIADAAAAALTRSEEYAKYLLSLAPRPGDSRPRSWRSTAGPPRLAHVQGIWGTSSDLYRRITMLLDSRRSVERRVPRWWSLGAGALFVAAAVLVSGVSVTARADDKQDEKKPAAKKQADLAKKQADLAKKQLKDALKAYEALVGEKGDLNAEQLRDALKLYQALVVDEKAQGDDAKKKVAELKDEIKKKDADFAKSRKAADDDFAKSGQAAAEAIRRQAEVQLKQAEAQLKAAQAQVEAATKQASEAAQRAKAQLDEQFKDPVFKDKIKDKVKEGSKWKLDARPEFFANQFELPNNAWLRFQQIDPKTGRLFLQSGGRLGVRLEVPGEALSEQLNLAKEQGLVVHDVVADSAAAKAGVQKHDIVLFFADQPVTHDSDKFVKQVREAKTGEPIEIVVLRKGKRVTLKATLAEAKKDEGEADPALPFFKGQQVPKLPSVQFQPGQLQALPGVDFFQGQNQPFIFNPRNANSVITTTVRKDDRFTTRHQEGSLIITITGIVEDGKAKVKEIVVQDGGTEKKYESLDKVADQYKDKVKDLVESSESGQVRVKVKTAK